MDFYNYSLIAILCVVLIFNFLYSVKIMPTQINPSSIYGFGFMVGAIFCYIFRWEWMMYDWSETTSMLIVIGVLSFTMTNVLLLCIFSIKKNNYNLQNRNPVQLHNYQLKNAIVCFILFYELLYFALYHLLVLGGVSLSNITQALLTVREEDEALPPLIQRMELFSSVFTYYMDFLFAKNLAFKVKNTYSKLVLLVSLVCIFGTFLSGAKGLAIYQILYIVFVWSIIKYKINPIKPHRFLGFKKIVKYCIAVYFSIFLFGLIADLQGRGSELGPLYYFGIYTGGGMRNLDLFVYSSPTPSTFWGEYSLHYFDPEKEEFHQHQIINGYPTGNLATALQYYYKDFGLIGTGFFVGIIAIIMYYLYRKSLLTKELEYKGFSIWIFLFAYLGRGLALSFFTETFFLLFFAIYQLRTIILILLFAMIMEKIGFKKVNLLKNKSVIKK